MAASFKGTLGCSWFSLMLVHSKKMHMEFGSQERTVTLDILELLFKGEFKPPGLVPGYSPSPPPSTRAMLSDSCMQPLSETSGPTWHSYEPAFTVEQGPGKQRRRMMPSENNIYTFQICLDPLMWSQAFCGRLSKRKTKILLGNSSRLCWSLIHP